MSRIGRSAALSQRVSYLYACALTVALYLFLPYGGYERMMEGKYACFLALTLGYIAAMCAVLPAARPRMTPLRWCAAAYFALSAVSALLSPYGTATLLGGPRHDGAVTLALYAAAFWLLSRWLRADVRLIGLTAFSVTLCDVLTLLQLAGKNPLWLYPAGLDYYDGDAAYLGFYAGTSGNVDFTAFLLALAVCVLAAAALRLRLWALAPTLALTLWVLWRLGVSAAWVGLAAAAVWCPALLVPARRRTMLLLSAALTLLALVLVWSYGGDDRTLTEASRLLHGEFDPSFGSERLRIWRDCLTLVRERPLFGGGPGTFWLRGIEPFAWYLPDRVVPSEVTAAHNEYLNVLVDQGAFALAAYLALLAAALVRCFRRAAEARFVVCGAGLLCYAAMAFFSISTCITAPYVWLLLALCAGEGGGTDREKTVENNAASNYNINR